MEIEDTDQIVDAYLCLQCVDDDDYSTVSSILSGLETRSLGLNTLGTR